MSAPVWIPRHRLPDRLREDEITPAIDGLWHRGRPLEELRPAVAVVGSRAATSYGLDVARMLGRDLARAGICVVSGMARGIDAAAHEGALAVNGETMAVLAGGVDRPYPASSRHLYEQIVAGAGAVLSETPLGADHRAENFLERNRIIAAISIGVVLVQADPRRSGALTTLRWAAHLNREVFAVPGDVRSVLSEGPHNLIRDGAHVCTGAQDILDVLGSRLGDVLAVTMELPPGLDERQRAMIEAINAGPASIDELAARARLSSPDAMRAATRLELAGLVVRDGGRYRRSR